MSEKKLDTHERHRSKTIAFRMSKEEAELLDQLVAVSGMTKQDYIISKLSDATVKVVPQSHAEGYGGRDAADLSRTSAHNRRRQREPRACRIDRKDWEYLLRPVGKGDRREASQRRERDHRA